jgi:hypothetical protein
MEHINELDLNKENKTLLDVKANTLIKKFGARRINLNVFENNDEIKNYITNFIKEREHIKNIAFSDSVTLYQLNIFDWIKQTYTKDKSYSINQPLERSRTGQFAVFGEEPPGKMNLPYEVWKPKNDQWYQGLRDSLTSDLLIIGANAITMNGEIVSVDGIGNRVSGMIFGPRHVLCIVGRNKIVSDVDAALERIHNYAAPMNYLRHNNKHWCNFQELPCIKIGKCIKCNHPESACLNTVIIRGQVKQNQDRIHILLVNQDLGF